MKKSFVTLLCLLFVAGCGSSSKESQTSLTTSEPEKVAEAVEPAKSVADEAALIAALEDWDFSVDGTYLNINFRDDGTTSEMDISQEFTGKFLDVEISEIILGEDDESQVFFSARVANDFFQTAEKENFSAIYYIKETIQFYGEELTDPEKKPLCEPTIPFDFDIMRQHNKTYQAAQKNSKGNLNNYPGDEPTYVDFTMDNVKDIEIINYNHDSVFSKSFDALFTLDNGWVVKNTLDISYDPSEHEENYVSDEKTYENHELWWIGQSNTSWQFQNMKE